MIEVALFPIPNVVAFPGTVLPLHVFEPRYRRLVHDCVEQKRPVGVSHVLKTIHEAPRQQSIEQALSSNQSTYQPRAVFSAGPCEIIETTPDGRILAAVTMQHRLALVEEVQSLPYRIVTSELLEDTPETGSEADSRKLQQEINNRLLEMAAGEQKIVQALQQGKWASLDPADFSFRIFQLLQFDADVMQTVLEERSAHKRLSITLDLLKLA